VGNKLKSLVQTAVCLDVQVFGVGVRDVKELLRIAVDRAAVVNFELYAKMTQAFAVENKVRRVTVLVNNVTMLILAGCAVGVVVTVPVRAVAADNAAAVRTADVILIKTVIAERVRVILNGVFLVDPLGAVVADYGQAICAVLAEPIAFYLVHIFD